MNAPYNQDVLAAAEACFAQASQLLYCEPDAEVVADQVAERPFQNAPFGMDDADVREGMQELLEAANYPVRAVEKHEIPPHNTEIEAELFATAVHAEELDQVVTQI